VELGCASPGAIAGLVGSLLAPAALPTVQTAWAQRCQAAGQKNPPLVLPEPALWPPPAAANCEDKGRDGGRGRARRAASPVPLAVGRRQDLISPRRARPRGHRH